MYLGRRMQRRLQAGAQCEDLRFYTPFFYRVGATLCTLGLDEHMPSLLLATWRVRYRQLLVPSLRGDSRHDSVELMSKLTVEEQRLFEAGHGGVLAFERYRGGKQILQRCVFGGGLRWWKRSWTGRRRSSASGRSNKKQLARRMWWRHSNCRRILLHHRNTTRCR